MDQLQREFLGEAEELIEVLIGDMQALRARHGEGRSRRELVGRIFRHVHTLKGSSAAIELDAISEIAHEFETLLDEVRLGRVAVDDAVLNTFEDAVTTISEMLRAVARQEPAHTPPAIIERLRRLAHKGELAGDAQARAPASAMSAVPEEIARSLSEYEEHRLQEALGEGARLFIVAVNFDLATFDDQFRDLSDALNEAGEMISTQPGMEDSAPGTIHFRILYATELGAPELSERLGPFGEITLTDMGASNEKGTVAQFPRPSDEQEYPESAAPTTITPLTTLVRVELGELDEMITAAHELFADTLGALDLTLLTGAVSAADQTELEIRRSRIRRRFVELEESLIGLRMVPVAQTLARALRAGAVAARATGKEIDFASDNGEVRLDKSLADAIADPLLHLLRNAVDHGIESPGEREAAGKSKRARIRLDAVAEGSRVRLRITDDGRGIDPERVAHVAMERGILEGHEKLSASDALRLIFAPGFSTAGAVSNVSGRGVGLDVVERAVEQIGGEIRVHSSIGTGTTFELILPTTMALVPSLIVRSGGYRFCVDASHIAEACVITAEEIQQLGESTVIRWRGAAIPLLQMRALLAQPPDKPLNGKRLHVIISRVAGLESEVEAGLAERVAAAVAVDGWDGHHEVLVRGLGRYSGRWRGISGATELSDGGVALILDLPRLLEMAL